MTERRAWVRWYWGDYLTGVMGLSAHERGVYSTLLGLMYEQGGPIKRDVATLARVCGTTPRNFTRALEALTADGKIEDDGSTLTNKRALQELKWNSHFSSVQSEKAKKRWNSQRGKKANKNNGTKKPVHQDGLDLGDAEHIPPARASEPDKKSPTEIKKDAGSGGPYVIERGLVRINQKTFDEWSEVYWAIPDLRAAIYEQATWGEGRYQPNDWFHRLSKTLGKKHQDLVAAGAEKPEPKRPAFGTVEYMDLREKEREFERKFEAARQLPMGSPEREAAFAKLKAETEREKAEAEAKATA